MNVANKIVWITGASSGIGEALVYGFNQQGANVILSSRRKDELERVKHNSLHPEKCFIYQLDLTKPDEIKSIANEVLITFNHVDILINNGGISQRSMVHETPVNVDRKIMEVNYFGSITLTKHILPSMLERKYGHIVAISSVVGKFGYPLRSAYSASKHALHGFYESLYTELRHQQIYVTIIYPGRIRTNISVNAMTKTGESHGQMDPGQEKGMHPQKCAKQIMKAISKKKIEKFVGGKEGIMVWLRKYAPALFFKLAQKISPT